MKSRPDAIGKYRLASAFFALLSLCTLAVGCHTGAEGERCNPLLVPLNSDCNSGLTCQMPSTCAENYCCPSDPSMSTNGYCNGQWCPSVDAGSTDAGNGG